MFNIYLSCYIPPLETILPSYVKETYNVAQEIKAYLIDWNKMDGFPSITLYAPAYYFGFVMPAWELGYIDETAFRNISDVLIKGADLMISYGSYETDNMKEDVRIARINGIPIYFMQQINKPTIESLRFTIKLLLKSK